MKPQGNMFVLSIKLFSFSSCAIRHLILDKNVSLHFGSSITWTKADFRAEERRAVCLFTSFGKLPVINFPQSELFLFLSLARKIELVPCGRLSFSSKQHARSRGLVRFLFSLKNRYITVTIVLRRFVKLFALLNHSIYHKTRLSETLYHLFLYYVR